MYAEEFQQQNLEQLPINQQDRIYEEEPSREYEKNLSSKKAQGKADSHMEEQVAIME